MGRPSKLTDRQWAEIGRRYAQGERPADLAREFKVSRPAIVARFSDKVSEIRTAANALASAEMAVERMPVPDAMAARALADHLKGVSNNLARAAESGSRVSAALSDIAEKHTRRLVQRMDEEGVLMAEELKPVAALVETSNRASTIGLGLLAAASKNGQAGDEKPALSEAIRRARERAKRGA